MSPPVAGIELSRGRNGRGPRERGLVRVLSVGREGLLQQGLAALKRRLRSAGVRFWTPRERRPSPVYVGRSGVVQLAARQTFLPSVPAPVPPTSPAGAEGQG